MRILSADRLHALKVEELGLDPDLFELTSPEAIACALRRVAGFLCPCAARTLVRSVVAPLSGLVEDLAATQLTVEEVLDALVANGDLLEQRDINNATFPYSPLLLYAAPPSFVPRRSGSALLLGIVPDHLSPLPEDLQVRIQYCNHVRKIAPEVHEDLHGDLKRLGLVELSSDGWLQSPPRELAAQHLTRFHQLLSTASRSGDVPGLRLLDPGRSARFYRVRWVEPKAHTGCFVARRPQAYGADLWCYVQMADGRPERFVDLPVAGSRFRGCDEAWHLQMAIDAELKQPQTVALRQGLAGKHVLDFFSPVPMWAQRRWNALGEPIMHSSSLFSYSFDEAEIAEEIDFARHMLWLTTMTK
jgi:hypothetical protein